MTRSFVLAAAIIVGAGPSAGTFGAERKTEIRDLVYGVCRQVETQRLTAEQNPDAETVADLVCQAMAGMCTERPEEQGCAANLLKYDAELGKFGTSLLYWAAYWGEEAFVAAMIAAGANTDFRNVAPDGAFRGGGWTPLMIAAAEGHEGIVSRLTAAGADVNTQNDLGRTALMFAASYGFRPIAQLLLQNGANVDTVPRDETGWTALIAAADAGHADVVTLLLEYGADRTVRDKQGKTALMHAEEHRYTKVARALTPDR